MKNIEKILEYMKGKEKAHLSAIWCDLGLNKNSVMGLINKNISENKLFVRLGDGYYKLKEGTKDGSTKQNGSDGKESDEDGKQKQATN